MGFARIARQAVTLLAPIVLVRLLSVEQFGTYRDFLLYGTLLYSMLEFSINTSLAYFVPKEPTAEQTYFTQATMFVFATSILCVVLLLIFVNLIPSETVHDYKYALCAYVFFVSNLDAWETFWIAKKQTINVLYYSLSRLSVRTGVVLITAYFARDAEATIRALVVVEAMRFLIMGAFALKRRLLVAKLEVVTLKAQIAYFGPLGASNLVYLLNTYLGQLFISALLGPAALAVYTVGTYLNPIIYIFRGTIGEVIMPEIVSRGDLEPKVALDLWQRATVVNCAVMLPLALLLFWYASAVVETLFTSAYVDAVPVFQILVFMLVQECVDFGVPLRAVNRTNVYFVSGILSLILNLTLVLILFGKMGILAPPLAMIVTRFLVSIYLATRVKKYCDYSLSELLPWNDIGKISMFCIGCAPILVVGGYLPLAPFGKAILGGLVYSTAYVLLLVKFGRPEIREFLSRLWNRFLSRTR